MNEKYLGYALLGVGIVIMLVATFQIYLVFTGKSEPYPLFKTGSVSLDIGKIMQGFSDKPSTQPATSQPSQLELIRAEDLNRSFNMTTHFFLMSFIASIGFKLSSLGTSLVRPIIVKAKEDRKEHSD